MLKAVYVSACLVSAGLLAGCSAGGVAGAVAQGVASEAVGASVQNASAQRMTCEQIERDIAARQRGKINPLAIPSINRQIARQEAVARSKGCPGF